MCELSILIAWSDIKEHQCLRVEAVLDPACCAEFVAGMVSIYKDGPQAWRRCPECQADCNLWHSVLSSTLSAKYCSRGPCSSHTMSYCRQLGYSLWCAGGHSLGWGDEGLLKFFRLWRKNRGCRSVLLTAEVCIDQGRPTGMLTTRNPQQLTLSTVAPLMSRGVCMLIRFELKSTIITSVLLMLRERLLSWQPDVRESTSSLLAASSQLVLSPW